MGDRQGAKQPVKQPGAAGYAGLHESRHQKAPLPSQLGGKVSSSQVLAERRTSSETGAAFSNTPVKGLDLKGSEKLSQVISGSPHHHQPMQSPRGKPNSDPHHNPYVPRPASRAMRDIYHQADRPMSRGLKEMDTHIRPMSRGRRERDTETRPMSRGMRDSDTRPMSRGGPTMGGTTTNMRSQLARASLTQDKFNRAGGATPVSRPDGSTGALSSMPPNLFQPPPTAALGDRILNKELSSSMMTQDPGCPGSPLGSRGEMRPPPPAGMRGALSWGVGPNAYEVDGRPGTRGGGPSCELEGSARPGTRGGRPASRMRGDSSGPLPQLQLAPLDGMDPPPVGKSLPEGAYPPPSSQGSRGAGRGLPLPSPGGGGKKPTPQTFPPGAMVGGSQSFVRASVSSLPENDLDTLIEALSDDGQELQDEASMNDMANYLHEMGNRMSSAGDTSSSKPGGKPGIKKGASASTSKTPTPPSKSHSRQTSLTSAPDESRYSSKSTSIPHKLPLLSSSATSPIPLSNSGKRLT